MEDGNVVMQILIRIKI